MTWKFPCLQLRKGSQIQRQGEGRGRWWERGIDNVPQRQVSLGLSHIFCVTLMHQACTLQAWWTAASAAAAALLGNEMLCRQKEKGHHLVLFQGKSCWYIAWVWPVGGGGERKQWQLLEWKQIMICSISSIHAIVKIRSVKHSADLGVPVV